MTVFRFRLLRWILATFSLLGSCWACNLTLFNYWAAGGPPTNHPEIYEQRGNMFLAVTVGLFVLSALLALSNIRRKRNSSPKE